MPTLISPKGKLIIVVYISTGWNPELMVSIDLLEIFTFS